MLCRLVKPLLGCRNFLIFKMVFGQLEGPMGVAMPNFIKTRLTIAEISQYNGFSKWQPSAIMDLLAAYLDHP